MCSELHIGQIQLFFIQVLVHRGDQHNTSYTINSKDIILLDFDAHHERDHVKFCSTQQSCRDTYAANIHIHTKFDFDGDTTPILILHDPSLSIVRLQNNTIHEIDLACTNYPKKFVMMNQAQKKCTVSAVTRGFCRNSAEITVLLEVSMRPKETRSYMLPS